VAWKKANRSKRFVQHEHKQKNAYVPTWTHSSRILGHTSPGDVFLGLPCRDDFSTISFGIQKNSGPPAECNDFYNFKIVGDKKTFSKSSVHMGETIKGMT
jgi:hypothetical protein